MWVNEKGIYFSNKHGISIMHAIEEENSKDTRYNVD
jgi:hypothetical protein